MKKIQRILIILIILIMLGTYRVLAVEDLKINIISSNSSPRVDDTINITISWSQEMQAAVYSVSYDTSKLQFISADISDTFYNEITLGNILVEWYGDSPITEMIFKFKTLAEGDTTISVIPDEFATENIEIPDNYITEPLTIKIQQPVVPTSTPTDIPDNTPNNTPTNTPTNTPINTPDNTPNTTPTNTPNNVPTNTPSNTPANTPSSTPINTQQGNNNEQQKDQSITNKEIPYTGKSSALIVFIIILSILAIIFKIKLRNSRDIK